MIKKLVCFAALCASMTGVAQAKDYRLTAEDLRITKNSTIVPITDTGVCLTAMFQLASYENFSELQKKYSTYFPHLTIPKVREHYLIRQHKMDLMEIKFLLSQMLYNPKANNYIYFQCDSYIDKDPNWSKEKFAEILTIEQAQQEIDQAYAEYLAKKNVEDSAVNRILSR
jgi:hypothetical protein